MEIQTAQISVHANAMVVQGVQCCAMVWLMGRLRVRVVRSQNQDMLGPPGAINVIL